MAYEVVREAGIDLGPKDRVEPDYWAPVASGMTLRVVRVQEVEETELRAVPFDRHTIKSLGLEAGERRLLQSGREGVEELVYLVVLEDGTRVSRQHVRTRLVTPPQDEVVAVGLPPSGGGVEFDGTVAYLAQGNAWLLRGEARTRRPLTTTGDLDGRVFELSPDGRTLLFTRREGAHSQALNSLWAVATDVVGAEPENLGITGVLRALWSPEGDRIIYTGGEWTEGSPGWRALNDLWVLHWTPGRARSEIRGPSCPGPYCWWGPELAWLPALDSSAGISDRVLVASPVGVTEVTLSSGAERRVVEFAPPPAGSGWVWVPEVGPHPAGTHVALAWPAAASEASEAGTTFDLAVVSIGDGTVVPLLEGVGMWARPRYSSGGRGQVRVAYAVADDASASAVSPYSVWVADADGSEARRLFPLTAGGTTIYEFTWSSDGYLLVGAESGLYLCGAETGEVRPLLEGLAVTRVRWAGPTP
ncbi:MAG: hypothetical protein HPY83_16260 [Anaerolineae bacterium]|nr:hypothetical protein [Anaerolineae bacterium]